MQTAWEDILHFIAARLKYVLVETCGFSLEIDKVICIVISLQKKVYITQMCLFTVGVLPRSKPIDQSNACFGR